MNTTSGGQSTSSWVRTVKKRFLIIALSTAISGSAGMSLVQATIQGVSSVGSAPPSTNVGKNSTPAFTDDQVNGTGAFSYRYPLTFPTGRHGAKPKVSLEYSSEAPLRGGVAAGWRLNVPMIAGDTTKGTWTKGNNLPERPVLERFVSSLHGGGELVHDADSPIEVPGSEFDGIIVFLALHDNTYVRYEKLDASAQDVDYLWRARTSDGHQYHFGKRGEHLYWRAPLIREIDPFGHTIEYQWRQTTFDAAGSTAVEYVLDHVRYKTELDEIYARVDFSYSSASCNGFPVGARLDYHYGTPQLHGSQRLDRIAISARRWEPNQAGDLVLYNVLNSVRRYELSYSPATAACNYNFGAPLRQLTSIQETGYQPLTRVAMTQPATTFTYGSFQPANDVDYVQEPVVNFFLPHGVDSADGRGVSRMWLDVNGDGLPDRLSRSIGNNAEAPLKVHFNDGSGGIASTATFNLPSFLPSVFGQDVSLGLVGNIRKFTDSNGDVLGKCPTLSPVGSFEYYGFVDVNHDQLLDLGIDFAADVGYLDPANYTPFPVLQGQTIGPKAIASTPWDQALSCPQASTGNVQSLVDCTLAAMNMHIPKNYCQHAGVLTKHVRRQPMLEWRVLTNDPAQNGTFASAHKSFKSNMPMPRINQGVRDVRALNGTPWVSANHAFGDFNGDGFMDRLLPDRNEHLWDDDGRLRRPMRVASPDDDKRFVVFGNRKGLPWPSSDQEWQMPDHLIKLDRASTFLTDNGGNAGALEHLHTTKTHNTLLDFNGDGLPDLVATSLGGVGYYPNTGQAFQTGAIVAQSSQGLDALGIVEVDVTEAVNIGWHTRPTRARRKVLRQILDFNGDGLLDLVEVNPISKQVSVWANNGFKLSTRKSYSHRDESKVAAALLSEIRMGVDGLPPEIWETLATLSDFTGDGHADLVVTENFNRKLYKATYPVASVIIGDTNRHRSTFERTQAAPFRLRTIRGSYGAITTVDYAASNERDVVVQEPERGYSIRKPRWVVKAIRVNPGGSQPSMSTQYSWRRPVWKQDLYGTWGFRGFEQREIMLPSGAQRVHTFDYNQHYAGLLAEEVPTVPRI